MQNLAVADRQHPHIGAGHLSRNILVDEFQEAEELCARTIQSIQYLASHVPTSVLKRLHIETLAQLEEERNQEWNTFDCSSYKPAAAVQEPAVQPAVLFDQMSIKDATKLRLMGRKRRNSLDRDSTENSSVISELSNVSQDGDSDDEGSPKDSRYPLQFDLGNRSHVELNALALHDSEPDLCSRQESLYVDHLLELATEEGCENRQDGRRPPRRRNRGATRRGSLVSQVSQVSILSHRYFNDAPSLPYASKHDSALLFVDISGFTQLSTLLDPESLSRAINNYFQLIVNEVTQHHGDIIKFAGDALYAEWKVSSNRAITSKSIESNVRMNLEDCVTAAAICGAKLVKNYCRHPIKTSTANPGVASQLAGKGLTLNVHCGISVGELVSVHFGDDKIRRENVVLGKAINDVSDAAMHAGLGEVAACPESIRVLSRTCKLDSTIDASNATEASVIADQSTIRFSPREEYTARYANKADSDPLASRVARLLHGWDSTKVVRFRKLLSLYAHPVVEANDAADFDSQISLIHLDERQVEEAELRNVFVMFIAPQISVSVTGNDAVDSNLFNLLNSVMNLVTTELSRFGGQLRQYIVDDKGLVLIATFGLRGSTFPNMVSEWALPSASSIHGKLQTKLGVQNRIGATVGNAYCGVVGGLMRHEYAVLGPSVNLAARLMVSDENPGILVDDSIRVMACKSYGFRALEAIKAKGYAEHVPIFEPLTPLQRRWGHTEPHFVGRGKELLDLKGIACGMAHSTAAPSKLVLISGVSGVGKSTLVVHAIDKIKEAMHVMKKRIFTRSTEKALREEGYVKCSVSLPSGDRGNESGPIATGSYGGLLSRAAKAQVADRLSALCCELNAPYEFAYLIGQHLMKLDLRPYLDTSNMLNGQSGANDTSLVNFISRAFYRCTQDADLTVVALDDVHLADDMSWKVVQKLFDIAPNIMMVCTTRPLSDYQLTIDDGFWKRLQVDHITSERYVPIKLQGLGMSETKAMIAKTLGIDEDEISERIHHGVFAQSSGIPQFAHVLLENLKNTPSTPHQKLDAVLQSSKTTNCTILESFSTQTSFHQLILQRLDHITGDARNILNLAAVIGASFEFRDIVDVLRNQRYEAEIVHHTTSCTRGALALAVQEGILYIEYNGCEMVDYPKDDESIIVENVTYLFSHDVWRSTILELMLGSRKRTMHRNIALTLESGCVGGQKGLRVSIAAVRSLEGQQRLC